MTSVIKITTLVLVLMTLLGILLAWAIVEHESKDQFVRPVYWI